MAYGFLRRNGRTCALGTIKVRLIETRNDILLLIPLSNNEVKLFFQHHKYQNVTFVLRR